jgi:hypothetical protein
MSALPPIADMVQLNRDVRFVPKADERRCSNPRGRTVDLPRLEATESLPGALCRG